LLPTGIYLFHNGYSFTFLIFVQGRLTYFLASLVLRVGIELLANALSKSTSQIHIMRVNNDIMSH